MKATSTRLSALFGAPSHTISTTRDHEEVASFEKVEVRPLADTMEPASPHERFEPTSVTRVSTKAVQPGAGMAIVTLPLGRELRLSCIATPRNCVMFELVKSETVRPKPNATRSPR